MNYIRIIALLLSLVNSTAFGQNNSTDSLLHYQKLVMQADSTYALAKDYVLALKKYQIAHEYFPNEQYPKNKIIQLTDVILHETYKVLIASANTCYENEDFNNALNYFKRAKEIFPNKKLPENYDLIMEKNKENKN